MAEDRAGWLRDLDQKEVDLLQQRKVPETLLQMITDSYVHVSHNKSQYNFEIHIYRQDKGYDREDPEIPRRRATFIKHALEEHFGNNIVVTGLSHSVKGRRSITMHVRPTAVNGRSVALSELPGQQQELVRFFEMLSAVKARQGSPDAHGEEIAAMLKHQVDNYRYHVRAINLVRHFPTVMIEKPRNPGKDFILKLPQEPGERKTIWKKRNDALLRELQNLFADKAVEFEEEDTDVPRSFRTGGNSLKSRVKYQIRVESNPVSTDIMTYMATLQQPANIRASSRM